MKLKNFSLLLASAAFLAGAEKASAQMFTTGDLVVSMYGSLTGTSITDGQATPITLKEYSLPTATSASLVLTDQLPTTGSNGNVGIDGEDGSSSEGTLQLSGNGEYLTIGGYDGNATAKGIQSASDSANGDSFAAGSPWGESTIALGQSSDTDVPRVAATIDAFGNVNTSTAYGDNTYNTNNPRSVYSPNGTTFYLSGQGSGTKVGSVYTDQGGIYTTTLGNNTESGGSAPTAIYTSVSTRDVLEYNGNLYFSADQNSKKGDLTGIFEYSGAPTTLQTSSGTRLTPASGMISGTAVNFSPEDFAFANATTMYVADTGVPKAGGVGDGGIQKWSLIDGAWDLDYTLTDPNFVSPSSAPTASHGETGFEDLAIDVVGGDVDIYAVSYTAGDADPNGLYAIVDGLSDTTAPTGANAESFTELEVRARRERRRRRGLQLQGRLLRPDRGGAGAGHLGDGSGRPRDAACFRSSAPAAGVAPPIFRAAWARARRTCLPRVRGSAFQGESKPGEALCCLGDDRQPVGQR